MKPDYVADNTRSSVSVILLLAVALVIVAALIGLSEKPDVVAIAIAADEVDSPQGPLSSNVGLGAAAASVPVELDETGQPIPDDDPDPAASSDGTTGTSGATQDSDTAGSSGEQPATTPIPIPTSTSLPTPEVAAAVEPAAEPDDAPDELDSSLAAPAEVTAGTIAGQFFTRPDEDEGATVARNELTLALYEDGTGVFSGVLDMTMSDSTHIVLEMSGPLRWSSETPQVAAELTGVYNLDSLIDADDVLSTEGELTISSLGSGSGSLCTPACFGFTFPAQTGL